MKYGRIIVEGLTDAYFIHQLIVTRFADVLTPKYDDDKGFRYPVGRDDPDEVFWFDAADGSAVRVEIRINGGSSKTEILEGLLRDESGEEREFHACVVFDADYPKTAKKDATGNGGFKDARDKFSAVCERCTGTGRGRLKNAAELFLFPNNQDDGTLETLLTSIAHDKRTSFFDANWPSFVKSLSESGATRELSAKTKLLNYTESYGKRISERKCYIQNLTNGDLWDYQSASLDRLVSFLRTFFDELAN